MVRWSPYMRFAPSVLPARCPLPTLHSHFLDTPLEHVDIEGSGDSVTVMHGARWPCTASPCSETIQCSIVLRTYSCLAVPRSPRPSTNCVIRRPTGRLRPRLTANRRAAARTDGPYRRRTPAAGNWPGTMMPSGEGRKV